MSVLAVVAGLCGLLAVALGAFGAHGLEGRLDAKALAWWGTASTYLLLHAGASLAVALSGRAGLMVGGGWCLALGALVFAGTLYAMALGAPRALGAVTPIGGVVMLVGWMLIVAGAVRSL